MLWVPTKPAKNRDVASHAKGHFSPKWRNLNSPEWKPSRHFFFLIIQNPTASFPPEQLLESPSFFLFILYTDIGFQSWVSNYLDYSLFTHVFSHSIAHLLLLLYFETVLKILFSVYKGNTKSHKIFLLFMIIKMSQVNKLKFLLFH